MKKLKTIKLKATKSKNISQAEDVFTGYIDSDFKNLNNKQKETKAQTVEILEVDKDSTFAQMFTLPKNQILTQSQIIEFCKTYKDDLRQNGYSTFFLFEENNQFFVADVYVEDGGLEVRVYEFLIDYVWDAGYRRRLVIPQLDSKTLIADDSLILKRLDALEKKGRKNL